MRHIPSQGGLSLWPMGGTGRGTRIPYCPSDLEIEEGALMSYVSFGKVAVLARDVDTEGTVGCGTIKRWRSPVGNGEANPRSTGETTVAHRSIAGAARRSSG